MSNSAFVLGASGAVGRHVVKELLDSAAFNRVVLITRRKLEGEPYQNTEQQIVDFDKLEEHADVFQGLEVGFCCLGTTRAKAGAAGFFKVDHDYVVNSAKIAKENGCRHFLVVSSTGASASSSFLYNSTKGKMEEELKKIGFEQLSIFRPAFLMGERDELRLTEKVVHAVIFPLNLICPTKASVQTTIVARALVRNAAQATPGEAVQMYYNEDIHRMGK